MGYVTKTSGPGELVRAVVAVAAGQRAVSEDAARAIADNRLSGPMALLEDLVCRETDILRMIASGKTSETIADDLNLSEKTVRNYHYAIKSKIGVQTDAQLVWFALSVGVISVDDIRTALPFPVPTLRLDD